MLELKQVLELWGEVHRLEFFNQGKIVEQFYIETVYGRFLYSKEHNVLMPTKMNYPWDIPHREYLGERLLRDFCYFDVRYIKEVN